MNNFNVNSISLVGGVAANEYLRNKLGLLAKQYDKKFVVPELEFCGDNAAMIAFRAKTLFDDSFQGSLSAKPYPSLSSNYFQSIDRI